MVTCHGWQVGYVGSVVQGISVGPGDSDVASRAERVVFRSCRAGHPSSSRAERVIRLLVVGSGSSVFGRAARVVRLLVVQSGSSIFQAYELHGKRTIRVQMAGDTVMNQFVDKRDRVLGVEEFRRSFLEGSLGVGDQGKVRKIEVNWESKRTSNPPKVLHCSSIKCPHSSKSFPFHAVLQPYHWKIIEVILYFLCATLLVDLLTLPTEKNIVAI